MSHLSPSSQDGWQNCPLSEVAHVLVSNVDKKSVDDEFPVRLCNYTDVYYNNYIDRSIDFMEVTATQAEIRKFALHPDDVIITKDSETPDDIAVPALVTDTCDRLLCGYHLAILRPRSDRITGDYLFRYFNSHTTRHYFFRLANGVTRFGLTIGSLTNARIPIPPKPQQERIGRILSTVDRAMERTGRLIEAKRKLKKGLAQQLLTGERRLPGFTEPWEKVHLSMFGRCLRGVSYRAPDDLRPDDADDTVRLLRAGNIAGGQVKHVDLQYVIQYRVQDAQILREHDVAICMSSGSKALVGKAARYVPLNGHRYTVGAFCSIFRPKRGAVAALIPQIFDTEQYRKWIYILTAGSSINNLTGKDIEKFSILLPTDKKEQARIAAVLGAADREIALLEKKLAALGVLKRGLMQKLLSGPSQQVGKESP